MARPNWEYIRVDVLMPDHAKVEELSDRAFRALITLWCYCGLHRNDGIVTRKRWNEVPAKARAELVAHGLADPMDIGGGAVMHDFTGPDGHQRSRQEIDELSVKRSESGRKAAAVRWGGDAKTHGLPHAKPHAPRIASAYAEPMPRQWQWQWQLKACATGGFNQYR